MKVVTIGFAKKKLEKFIKLLTDEKVTHLIDTRLNNTSQLSGFAKKDDLKFIMEKLVGINYEHCLNLAPTKDILDDYKKGNITWNQYEERYISLLKEREIELILDNFIEGKTVCFLCSEHKHEHCHRSLLVNYIKQYNREIEIVHLE